MIETSKALAEALGVSAPRVCKIRKHSWFPAGPPWVLADVVKAIERNRIRSPRAAKRAISAAAAPPSAAPLSAAPPSAAPLSAAPPSAAPLSAAPPSAAPPSAAPPSAAPPSAAPLSAAPPSAAPPSEDPGDVLASTGYPESLLLALSGPASSALEIATAAARLAAIQLARGKHHGDGGQQDFAQLKQSLEELRRASGDYLDLAVAEGNLVRRDVAVALAGRLVQQLLQTLSNVEAMLPVQVEVWLARREFCEAQPERRRSAVAEWFRAQARALREADADSLEAMLRAESA